MRVFFSMVCFTVAAACAGSVAVGQNLPHVRIVGPVDESRSVTLEGNVHPLVARSVSEKLSPATAMEHMILSLKADPAQEAALEVLIAQQNDPKSAQYHHFLSPAEFGSRFGVAQADVDKVTSWLRSHGFAIEEVAAGRRSITFSGTAGEVESAFKTEIRSYHVDGSTHVANASNPQVPAALSAVVGGVVKLHDFRHTANLLRSKTLTQAELANPQFTYGSAHYLSPADYATIYDINPLYTSGVNGTGQSIAIIARSDIYASDVQTFRSDFGLPANQPTFITTNSDPGVLGGDTSETTLDTEWAGAVAPKAAVKVIISASTYSADGIDLSALYAVNNNVAPIISVSYGSCEARMGSAELAFYNSLWKQAAGQGISVMVSSGDSSAAGCDDPNSSSGSVKGVNGLCSSPYSTCVGGTEFAEGNNPGQYWLPGNNSIYGSALSYIPEAVWNESGADGGSGLWGGGGGSSIAYAKPSWQTGPGVPADGARDVPDVSMAAAIHDAYVIVEFGGMSAVGGTSAAAPSFAGVMALVNQKTGSKQGLANATLYPLAINQSSGGAAVFHDITAGNNSVVGLTGFPAGSGYDLASGLGSVDAALLVNHWTDAAQGGTASLTLSSSQATLAVAPGKSIQTTITATAANLKSAVALSVSGAPSGLTATLGASSIASPGTGSVALTVTAASTLKAGTYALVVTGQGGGQTSTATVSVVVAVPTFTLTSSVASLTLVTGTSGQVTISTTPQNGFTSALALSVSGLPAGVTGTFSAASVGGASAGSSTLSVTVANSAVGGSYALKVSATGGGVTQTSSVTLVVTVPPSCTLSANPTSLTVTAGQSGTLQIGCSSAKGTFSGPLTLSFAGLPSTVTATGSSLTAGSTTSVTLAATAKAAAGSYTLSVTAAGSGFSKAISVPLKISVPSNFSLSASQTALSVNASGSAAVSVTTAHSGSFNSAVALTAAGLPSGVTAGFSKSSFAAPGDGSATVTFAATAGVKAGVYNVTLSGTGGGLTETAAVALTLVVPASCTLAANPAAVNLIAGQSTAVQVSCGSAQGTFNGPLALTFAGLPSTVTATGSSLTAGSSTTVTLAATSKATAGTSTLSITAAGSGFSKTISVPVTMTVPSTFALTSSQSTLSLGTGSSNPITLTTVHSGAFNSTLALSVSGVPAGVTATLSKTSIAAPGDGSVSVSFQAGTSAKKGTYPVTLTAVGGGVTQSVTVNLTVVTGPNFVFTLSANAISLQAGGAAGALTVSTGQFTGGFNSTITIIISGLPYGMTYNWTNSTASNNMVNTSYGITASSSLQPGTYPLTVSASGAGISYSGVVQVTVAAPSTGAKH